MPQIELIQFPRAGRLESISPFCVKVQRILNYKRLPYQVRDVTMPPGRALNPAGKLPVLVYDGEVVPDSSRIAWLLERRHPEPPLAPRVAEAQALSNLLEDWADESLYWALLYLRWRIAENAARMRALFATVMRFPLSVIAPPLIARQIRRALRAQGIGRLPREIFLEEFRRTLASLEVLATRAEFLGGPALTVGDVAVFAQLNGIREAPLRHGGGELDGFPALGAWYTRVDALTANTTGTASAAA